MNARPSFTTEARAGFELRGPYAAGSGCDYAITGPRGETYTLNQDHDGLFDLYCGSECLMEPYFRTPEEAVEWLEEGHDAFPVEPITARVRELSAPEFVKELCND